MFRTLLQSVLLVTVVYSQVLGGISCCCLGRTLLAGVNSAESAASSESVETHVKCPKCLAKAQAPREQAVTGSAKRLEPSVKATESLQCNCAKHAIGALSGNEKASKSVRLVVWQYVFASPLSTILKSSIHLRQHEVPLRFGGHSWQAVACVWNN